MVKSSTQLAQSGDPDSGLEPAEWATGARQSALDSRAEYQKNKSLQFNSKAKSLLYHIEDRAATPVHHGKKSVPHIGEHNAAPFATFDGVAPLASVQGGQMRKTYQSPNKKKEGAGKIGSMEYGTDVYRNQIMNNQANLHLQKTRNWGQQGLLGQQAASGTPLPGGRSGLASGLITPHPEMDDPAQMMLLQHQLSQRASSLAQ